MSEDTGNSGHGKPFLEVHIDNGFLDANFSLMATNFAGDKFLPIFEIGPVTHFLDFGFFDFEATQLLLDSRRPAPKEDTHLFDRKPFFEVILPENNFVFVSGNPEKWNNFNTIGWGEQSMGFSVSSPTLKKKGAVSPLLFYQVKI